MQIRVGFFIFGSKSPAMHTNICLNCEAPVSDKFCSRCGQKTDTHRITAKHFIFHDLVHGVWHVDRGILVTTKEVFTRPGYAARDYIAGKRIKYYNIFYLMLLLLGVMLIVGNYVDGGLIGKRPANEPEEVKILNDILSKYTKLLYLALIPVFAFNGWLLFRKLKFNFTEHLIMGGFVSVGLCLFVLSGMFLDIFNNTYADLLSNSFGIICLLYPCYAYYQFAKYKYTIPGFGWRIVLLYALLYLEKEIFIGDIMLFLLKQLLNTD